MGTFENAKVGDWVYTKGRFRHSRNLWQIAKVTKARIYRFANDPPHRGISRSKDFARVLGMTEDEVVAKLGVDRMATLASWLA